MTALAARGVDLVRQASASGSLVWALVAVIAVQGTFASEFFLTGPNLANLAGQMVPLGLAALGQTAAILVATIDLSVGATAKLSALLTAGITDDDPSRLLVAVVVALAVSALVGALNGGMVVGLRMNPLIATLITFTLLRGVALAYTQTPIGGIPSIGASLIHGRLLGLPYPAWLLLALAAAMGTFLSRTRYGRSVYAVGGDDEVARRAGVAVGRVRFSMMVLCSTFAGLAGVMLALRQGVGDPRVADGLELVSIVAVVIGGVSIFGGRGRLVGVLGGVVFLNILRNVMNLQDVEALFQQVVTGALVIIAVVLFTRREE